jgi:hypothetical protein
MCANLIFGTNKKYVKILVDRPNYIISVNLFSVVSHGVPLSFQAKSAAVS